MSEVIVSARITKMPDGLLDPMPEVYARLRDGREIRLFSYYPDEISFTADEFAGLTVAAARQLKCQRDIEFLSGLFKPKSQQNR